MRERWLAVLRYFGLAGMPVEAPSLEALNMTMTNILGTWRRVDLWGDWSWT